MKEARFFFVPDAVNQTELPQEETTHALRVLRLKAGDEIFLMDGCGCFYRAEVVLAAAKKCMYEIKESIPQDATWNGHIHLAIAPTKMMERIEWLAEKATEIGFDEISFLNCKFSERKIIKTERIDKIIISALKQSRKATKPQINQIMPFNSFVSEPRQGRKYICHCYDEIESKDFFAEITRPIKDDADADITVLVGPEGDFSLDEVHLAIRNGYEPVSLGKSRLRTETAGLYAVMMSQMARRKY